MFAIPLAVIVPQICDASDNSIISKPEELAQQSEPVENIVTKESSSSARGENMKASCGANHDDLTLKTDDNADILANDLVDVDLKMSSR